MVRVGVNVGVVVVRVKRCRFSRERVRSIRRGEEEEEGRGEWREQLSETKSECIHSTLNATRPTRSQLQHRNTSLHFKLPHNFYFHSPLYSLRLLHEPILPPIHQFSKSTVFVSIPSSSISACTTTRKTHQHPLSLPPFHVSTHEKLTLDNQQSLGRIVSPSFGPSLTGTIELVSRGGE